VRAARNLNEKQNENRMETRMTKANEFPLPKKIVHNENGSE